MATVRENYVSVMEYLKNTNAPAELVEFMATRVAQEEKARESAKAKRIEKNGGERKNTYDSPFYTNLRNEIYKVLTTNFQTGDELISKADVKTDNGKTVLAAQVAMALKPLIADGTVVVGEVKVSYTDKHNLTKESMRKAYKLA